ncbi:ABC transporter permease subunit [Bacillus sp. N9]
MGNYVPGVIEAFGVFLMRQFMTTIPNDTLDAARIDGMGEFKIWWRVAMPQVKPALSALEFSLFRELECVFMASDCHNNE